jgi:hypothetical protein
LPAIDLGTGKTAVQLVAGGSHTCVLLNDGSAKCWGAGSYGRLGHGNTNDIGDGANEMGNNLTAIDLGAGKTAVQLVAGNEHTCALLNDGNAKCWGSGNLGRLGYGNTNHIGDGANEMGDNLPAIDLGTKPWTTCVAGEKVTVNGTAASDRQCGDCAARTFTSATNQQSCTPWTTCVAGENVTVNGTAASDRQCGACAAETFTSATNQQSCIPWTTCVAGEKVTVNGTATADRQCGASSAPAPAAGAVNTGDSSPSPVLSTPSPVLSTPSSDDSPAPAPAAGAVNTGGSSPSPVLSTPSPVLSTPSSDAVKDIAASVPSPSDDNDPFVFESELNAAIRSHQMLTLCIVCSTFVVTLMLALM